VPIVVKIWDFRAYSWSYDVELFRINQWVVKWRIIEELFT